VSVEIETDPKKRDAGRRVLIVDDDPAMRKKLAEAFLSDGFKTCAEAANGKEGIELAERIRPDVITLDLSMPVMNGLQAAPELRKLFPKTPIIFFTLFVSSQLVKEAPKAGVNLVLSKAVSMTTLLKQAHKLIGD
jgi:two-component system chemotaxis response regulator CheY